MATARKKRKSPTPASKGSPRIFLLIAGIVLALLVGLFLIFVSV